MPNVPGNNTLRIGEGQLSFVKGNMVLGKIHQVLIVIPLKVPGSNVARAIFFYIRLYGFVAGSVESIAQRELGKPPTT